MITSSLGDIFTRFRNVAGSDHSLQNLAMFPLC